MVDGRYYWSIGDTWRDIIAELVVDDEELADHNDNGC